MRALVAGPKFLADSEWLVRGDEKTQIREFRGKQITYAKGARKD
jgi:hypothetical protein